MTLKYLTQSWINKLERMACMIQSEFAGLDAEQLSYSLHIHHCNIRMLMYQFYYTGMLSALCISRSLKMEPPAGADLPAFKEQASTLRKILKHHYNCKTGEKEPQSSRSDQLLFNGIDAMLKSYIVLINSIESRYLTRKSVPYSLGGIVRIRTGKAIELSIDKLKRSFTAARQIYVLLSL